MTTTSDIETADRLARRRARVLPVLAVLFVAQQGAFFSSNTDQAMRTVDHFKISAWLAVSVVLLAALSTNGFWFRSANVRALMDDEVTRANRVEAFRLAFLIAMGAGILLYFISLYEPLGGREAIHAMMTAGIGTALIRFGLLERRALKGG